MQIQFIDENGSFSVENPQRVSALYFPIAADGGIKASVTPLLGGDAKLDQNSFLLEPVSVENLHNNRATRNFWCSFANGEAWSATGVSAEQEAKRGSNAEDSCELTAGFMWHTVRRCSREFGLCAEISSFVPLAFKNTEVMLVRIKNVGIGGEKPSNEERNWSGKRRFTPIAAIPMYGRSADNIRDHRHVSSLLHRARTVKYGVTLTPTLSFDERGHKKNTISYYVLGTDGQGVAPVGTIPVVEDFIGEGGSFTRPAAVYGERWCGNAAQGNHAHGADGCKREAVFNDKGQRLSAAGECFDGYETMGALVFDECELAEGEEAVFVVCMGIDEGGMTSELVGALETFRAEDWNKQLEAVKQHWCEQVNLRFHTGDSRFDSHMCWIAFQPLLRRIYGCSFLPHHDYGRGGRGWRDLWQDCLALLIMNPDGVRKMLLDNFGGVRMDGSNATIIGSTMTKKADGAEEEQVRFIADRNHITRVWMDHGFWPLYTTAFYIHQTGDLSLLLEQAGYFKDRQVVRGEETDEEWKEVYGTEQRAADGTLVRGTVLEHILIQSLTAFYDVGEHNRIRLRGADWNDALDMAVERGESVAFTFAYAGNFGTLCGLLERLLEEGVTTLSLTAELLPLLSRDTELYADAARKRELLLRYCKALRHNCSGERAELFTAELIETLRGMEHWWKETLRSEEWLEGEEGFFNGYYDNNGRAVESSESGKRRMMLTGQVFAVMSGVADEEQVGRIIKAADRALYRETGGYCLNTDFQELKDDLGRMFGFAYGHKENGAVFSHMAVMYGNALYGRGFSEAGYRALNALYRQAANTEESKIYPGLPEYFSPRGRGMYHYLTGAASWYLMTVLTQMFGVHGVYGDLYLQPQLLEEQFDAEGKAAVSFSFLGRRLKVTYIRAGIKHGDGLKISVHGKEIDGACISREELLSWDKAGVHEITVLM